MADSAANRIAIIDLARGVALVAMIAYHFAWDLSYLGFIATQVADEPGWRLFAQGIAASFLALAGFSLALAHGEGLRVRAFWRRVGVITAAALAVTAATWWFLGDSFMRFGILHCIALGSVLLIPLVRAPWWVPLPLAALVAGLPAVLAQPFAQDLQNSLIAGPLAALWQISGLSVFPPVAVDFVPLFPWAAAMLAGLSLGLLVARGPAREALAAMAPPHALASLARAGRWSLPVYLIHQPVLLGLLGAAALLWPDATPAQRDRAELQFRNDCIVECRGQRSAEQCLAGCSCLIERLREDQSMFERVIRQGEATPATQRALEEAVRFCVRPAPSH